jgi:diguanylate cyclase (GGDEF)-like protein
VNLSSERPQGVPPVPLADEARVAALHRLGLLDQPPAADLEGLTRLATYVTGAPMSVVNLLDLDRQWQAAATGMPCVQVPREDAMCGYAVADDRLVHVADCSKDDRFAGMGFVDGRLGNVRMYAAVPLHDHEGYAVGTLCVVDPRVRGLTGGQLEALRDLAAQAEQLLELRRQHLVLLDVLAEVDHFASHDPLTGLVNRRVLLDRLELALARAVRTGTSPVLFFCDVDGFKAVNDRFGHSAGDAALVSAGRRLRELVRPFDTVARLGGDEFVVLCEDLPERDTDTVATRLRAARYGQQDLRLSVGVCRAEPGSTAAQALGAADALMYAEKRRHAAVPAQPAPAHTTTTTSPSSTRTG